MCLQDIGPTRSVKRVGNPPTKEIRLLDLEVGLKLSRCEQLQSDSGAEAGFRIMVSGSGMREQKKEQYCFPLCCPLAVPLFVFVPSQATEGLVCLEALSWGK